MSQLQDPSSAPEPAKSPPSLARRLIRPAQVIIVSSVMFTFISYWRTAAVVLCDLASTAYYIGGIVEQSVGIAAPWLILAVMLFSYAVRSVYIESCSLFVRGGVYRVVKEAMGGFLGKLSVSALMFDYILTGPTSGVSAGQYIVGLILDSLAIISPELKITDPDMRDTIKRYGSVLIACGITVYFFRQNLIGIHESSDKALKIMIATTIMAAIILVWCLVTLAIRRGPVNDIMHMPDLSAKVEYKMAARYQLNKEALDDLQFPAPVVEALHPLLNKDYRNAKDFERDVLQRLTDGQATLQPQDLTIIQFADEWPEDVRPFRAPVLAYARIVEFYKWTDDIKAIAADDGVPEETLNKLDPLKTFQKLESLGVFEAEARKLLTAEEWKAAKYVLFDRAAVTQGIDRVTGEKKLMWARDPDTGQLVPDVTKNHPEGRPKINEATHNQDDPLGFLGRIAPAFAKQIRQPGNWLSIIGVIGLFIAFGHSILAMSGEETLAQVYREVESPKLPNFKKAAFIVFVYSLALTASISFLAVLLIPNEVRMLDYSENLIGGLTMYVSGHAYARLALNMFVVVVGFLILAGAVNTAIIGSNGVLNRVAEDGVLPDWFLKPHPRYGTTYRILYLIVGLQLAITLLSRGNMIILGEAYAFGVVWSFVFKALAMVVLRFKDRTPREYKVPLNVRVGGVEIPIGLGLIFLILLFTAILNFFTKEVATIGGIVFTFVFLVTFMLSEHYHEKRRKGTKHAHLEQFNQAAMEEVTAVSLGLRKPYRKLVSIRSTQNLYMLEKALAETDPETTDMVVMTAKVTPLGGEAVDERANLDSYDQQLMTAVVERAEKAGKVVKPLIVPTNQALYAVLKTAKDLQANEVILGASNKFTADEQLEQVAFIWINLHDGHPAPLTVRILSRDRDMYLDLAGGNRIPKISERKARSVAELRAAGVGVDRVLLAHDGTTANSDLFQAVLTMLDAEVRLAIVPLAPPGQAPVNGNGVLHHDKERARQLDRPLTILHLKIGDGPEIVQRAREEQYDLIILPMPAESPSNPLGDLDARAKYILHYAHCRVFLASTPAIPQEVVDTTPSGG